MARPHLIFPCRAPSSAGALLIMTALMLFPVAAGFLTPLSSDAAEDKVVQVVEAAGKAIVNIKTEELSVQPTEDKKPSVFKRYFAGEEETEELVENFGSGVVLDPKGIIVTNDSNGMAANIGRTCVRIEHPIVDTAGGLCIICGPQLCRKRNIMQEKNRELTNSSPIKIKILYYSNLLQPLIFYRGRPFCSSTYPYSHRASKGKNQCLKGRPLAGEGPSCFASAHTSICPQRP